MGRCDLIGKSNVALHGKQAGIGVAQDRRLIKDRHHRPFGQCLVHDGGTYATPATSHHDVLASQSQTVERHLSHG